MKPLTIRTGYYQQFDSDGSRDVPAEAVGGWKEAPLTFDLDRMAVVVMDAVDCGSPDELAVALSQHGVPAPGKRDSCHRVRAVAVRQAVTAIESRESARTEAHEEAALWLVALSYGFVFDLDAFTRAIAPEDARCRAATT
jgi:hypothetical protein